MGEYEPPVSNQDQPQPRIIVEFIIDPKYAGPLAPDIARLYEAGVVFGVEEFLKLSDLKNTMTPEIAAGTDLPGETLPPTTPQ